MPVTVASRLQCMMTLVFLVPTVLSGAYWSQNYKIIYQCNEILDDIEKEPKEIRYRKYPYCKGESLFFRATCYINLVRAFGEVPLEPSLKVVEASDANVPKTTAEKIQTNSIDKYLTTAEDRLPLRWNSNYTGRVTWGAALLLKCMGTYIYGKRIGTIRSTTSTRIYGIPA